MSSDLCLFFFRLISFVSHHLFILIFGDNELTDGISTVLNSLFSYSASFWRVCRSPGITELLIPKSAVVAENRWPIHIVLPLTL